MADEKKDKKEEAAKSGDDTMTTDTNAGPDADFGDGEYHAGTAPQRTEPEK